MHFIDLIDSILSSRGLRLKEIRFRSSFGFRARYKSRQVKFTRILVYVNLYFRSGTLEKIREALFLLSLIESLELLVNLLEIWAHVRVLRPRALHHLDVLRRGLGLGDLWPTEGRRLLDFAQNLLVRHVEHVEGASPGDDFLHDYRKRINIPLLGPFQQHQRTSKQFWRCPQKIWKMLIRK